MVDLVQRQRSQLLDALLARTLAPPPPQGAPSFGSAFAQAANRAIALRQYRAEAERQEAQAEEADALFQQAIEAGSDQVTQQTDFTSYEDPTGKGPLPPQETKTTETKTPGDLQKAMMLFAQAGAKGHQAGGQLAAALFQQQYGQKQEPYTLSPNAQRRGPNNELLADNPVTPDRAATPAGKIQEYQLAVQQGFKGTYLEFLKESGLQAHAYNDADETFTPEAQDILAALAAKGIALPVGFRSRAQMVSTLNGLVEKFPNESPDEIARRIGKGQVDFGAIKKETQTAAAAAGRVAIAANELDSFAPLILDASTRIDRTKFVPYNRLKNVALEQISDPDLLQLKIGINSMLNAYDQLAARGGTDMNKRKEAHSLLETAQSPEALAAGIKMFQLEAAAAIKAAEAATAYRDPIEREEQPDGEGASTAELEKRLEAATDPAEIDAIIQELGKQ